MLRSRVFPLHFAGAAILFLPFLLPAPAIADVAPLDTIIVTAQKRQENLQDVPLSVTLAGQRLLANAHVETIADISSISPGTRFDVGNFPAASANIIIRGLGTAGQNRSFEGSVGVFIDGVYRTRAGAALQTFLDIDSLQILKGPQGTLFGKNTTAGALLLTSTRPELAAYGGSASLDYGNYRSLLARASVNVPLGAHTAVRLAGLTARADNFFTDPTTNSRYPGDDTAALKGQLLFEPSASFSAQLIGDYSKTTSICCYLSNDFVDGPDEAIVKALGKAAGSAPEAPAGKLVFSRPLTTTGNGFSEDYGATLQLTLAAAGGTLKSISAWREFRAAQRDMDGDLGGADIERYSESFKSRFFSQELTYTGEIRPLAANLVAGLYFSDEKLAMGSALAWGTQAQAYWDASLGTPGLVYAAPGIWGVNAMQGRARSWAAYAHLDLPLFSQVRLFGGLRTSIEKKRGSFAYPFYRQQENDVLRFFGVMPGPAYAQATTNRALSGTLGLSYQPTPALFLYASYNRGFKAGGVNIDGNAAGGRLNNPAEVAGAIPLSAVYQPETVDALEAGLKLSWLGDTARSNIAFFHYALKNVQIAQFMGLQFAVLNARRASDTGLEIENLFTLLPGVTLGLDGTWLPKAHYGSDPRLPDYLRKQRFRFAPALAGNATLNFEQPLGDKLQLWGRLQYQYMGRQFINTASAAERGPLGLVNASLGFFLPERGVRLEAWSLNLTNRHYSTQAFNTPVQAGDENVYLGAPRTFGVRLAARF